MKKISIVCDEIPRENFKGYLTYNHAFIKSLSSQGYDINLIITGNRFDSFMIRPSEIMGIEGVQVSIINAYKFNHDLFFIKFFGFFKRTFHKLSQLKTVFKRIIFNRNQKIARIGRWLSLNEKDCVTSLLNEMNPDVVFVDTIFRTPSFDKLHSNIKKVLIGHDVFFERCDSFLKNKVTPLPFIDKYKEAAILCQYDSIVSISQNDKEAYKSIFPEGTYYSLPSPIDLKERLEPITGSNRFIYIGSNAHHNVDGLRWFLKEVWPLVKRSAFNLRLYVIGDISQSFHHDKSYDGVTFLGRVEDIKSVAGAAMFAINPVRMGSGLKIKILDYLSYGLPCVTTKLGALGFDTDHNNSPIIVCNDSNSFSKAIIDLSSSTDRCNELSECAQEYIKNYSEKSFNFKLSCLLQEVTEYSSISN